MQRPIDLAIAELAIELAASATVEESIGMITAFAAETLGTSHAGATLLHHGGKRFATAGATDPIVEQADRLQNELVEGPCVDAAVSSRTVVSHHLAADPRWPKWGPRAAALGLGSILSSEMHAGDRRIGALNIYGVTNHRFTRADMETAHLLAYHAAAALRTANTIAGLTRALDSRTLIGQAQGILMERYGIDAERAFSLLRRYSQDENIRLVDVAASLLTTQELPQRQS